MTDSSDDSGGNTSSQSDVMSLDDLMPRVRLSSAPKPGPIPYRVVIGLAFDATGVDALREAFRIAESRHDAELHAVHAVVNTASPSLIPGGVAALTTALSDTPKLVVDFITGVRERIAGAEKLSAVVHVRVGDPASAVDQAAIDLDADLIIVGTHSRKGIRRLALGSVSSALVQNAHCPVLVARSRDYTGLPKSAKAEPVCEDCGKIRAETNGASMWCEYHARPNIRVEPYGSGA